MSAMIAGPAVAQETSELPPRPVLECFCTDTAGSRVELGETICLTVDGRAFLARCEMSLNSPMWRDTGADCVGAAVRPPIGGQAGQESAIAQGG